jgi:hypothetical protein
MSDTHDRLLRATLVVLATQLEVSDSRLALLQARTNLAQALADFYIADAGVARALAAPAATVPTLPAPTGSSASSTPGASPGTRPATHAPSARGS